MDNCFVLVAHWFKHGTIVLETTKISSIGFSDRDSSHASQNNWLRPRSPKTAASDMVREAKQQSTEVSSSAASIWGGHSPSVAEPTFFNHLKVAALTQSLLLTLVFIVDPAGDLGPLDPRCTEARRSPSPNGNERRFPSRQLATGIRGKHTVLLSQVPSQWPAGDAET